MKIYSFEQLTIKTDGFYDLFEKTMKPSTDFTLYKFVVTDEYKGRLDLVSRYLYGSSDYVEELMKINNIINPLSVKGGDIIYHPQDSSSFTFLYDKDIAVTNQKDEILMMNKNKSTKTDSNRLGSPPTIKPDNLKQLDINYNKKKITVINKFK